MILQLFNMVLYASLVGSIVAAVILLLKLLFKRYFSARWQYWIWLILILRLMLPVSFSSHYNVFSALNLPDKNAVVEAYTVTLSKAQAAQQVIPEKPVSSGTANSSPASGNAQNENSPIPLSALPAIIWACVASGIFVFTLLGFCVFSYKLRHLPLCDNERVERVFEECRSVLRIKRQIRLLYMRSNKSPALTGIFHPAVIISPSVAESLSDEDLRHVFMHELSHQKSSDILVGFVITLTEIIHWFNPVVLYCMHQMRIDCEVACDSLALSFLEPSEHKSYGETIIKLCELFSQKRLNPWVAGIAGKGQIKRRILMIINFKKASIAGTCFAVALSLAVGCSVLTDKMASPRNSLSAASVGTVAKSSGNLSLASFSSIKKYVKATFYENVEGTMKNKVVSGSYDLAGDGKKENIKLTFASLENGGKPTLTVQSKKLNLDQFEALVGVYAVDLDKSDKYTELAVVEGGFDADVHTYFYRYDGSLKYLGYVLGSFVDRPCYGYNLKQYNIGVLADGKGKLIPRYGVMRFVNPQIMLNAFELKNNKIQPISLKYSGLLNKTYKASYDIKPYFEQMSSIPKGFETKFNNSDIITIKKGDSIKLKSISATGYDYYSLVQLQNKKQGVLYFYIHP